MLCLSPGLALHAWERDDPRPPICTRPRSFFFFISFYGGVREGGEPHTHTHTYYWVLFFTPTRKRWGWYPVHDVSQPLMWDLDYEMWCVRFLWFFFTYVDTGATRLAEAHVAFYFKVFTVHHNVLAYREVSKGNVLSLQRNRFEIPLFLYARG